MAYQDFDLLGDPVPANFGGRGRPEHVATDEKARIIIVLAALRKTKGEIAQALGITQPTLNKHYFSGDSRFRIRIGESRHRLEAKLLGKLLGEAEGGNVAAIKALWDRLDKAEMKALAIEEARQQRERAAPVGKKEAADRAAKTAHEATSWQDLLQ